MTPDEVEALFPRSIPTGAQYGTITVRIADADIEFEVTTLRSEGSYGDGRRPSEVTFGQSLKEDLSRRDFTINAMAIDLARNLLHDPYHGQSDLQNRRLSAVGDAAERLGEDGLRVLRAYRFMDQESRGLWEPDEHLASALKICGEMLEKVSQERIWSEFNRILGNQRAPKVLERMRIDGVLSRILPGWDAELESQHELSTSEEDVVVCRLVLLSSNIPAARWRVLDHDMRSLTIPNHTRKRVLKLHGIIGHLPHDLASCRRYRICIDEDVNAHIDIESALNRNTADAARILIKKHRNLREEWDQSSTDINSPASLIYLLVVVWVGSRNGCTGCKSTKTFPRTKRYWHGSTSSIGERAIPKIGPKFVALITHRVIQCTHQRSTIDLHQSDAER